MFYIRQNTIILLLVIFLSGSVFAGGERVFDKNPPANFIAAVNTGRESHRILFVNEEKGPVKISLDDGKTWRQIGQIIMPIRGIIHEVLDYEFTASDWAPVGSVAASAVNAIHIKSGQGNGHAFVFSIHPREVYESSATLTYYTPDSAIYTSISVTANNTIFSGKLAPHVGDPIFKMNEKGDLIPWKSKDILQVGERFVIVVNEPDRKIEYVEFNNHWGGLVQMKENNTDITVARVYRPVQGCGRFGGSLYQDVGLLRANHPGVICVSTSPYGVLGGFQIIPNFHANSDSLNYVVGNMAYMVIGPVDSKQGWLEGTFPFYNRLFRPGDRVEAKLFGQWQKMPEASGLKSDALKNLQAIRIYPTYEKCVTVFENLEDYVKPVAVVNSNQVTISLNISVTVDAQVITQ